MECTELVKILSPAEKWKVFYLALVLDCDVPILESFAESVCFLAILDENEVEQCLVSIGKLLWKRINQLLGLHATIVVLRGPDEPPESRLDLYKWNSKQAVLTVNVWRTFCSIAVYCKTKHIGYDSFFDLNERFDVQNPMPLQQRFRLKDWLELTEDRLQQLVNYFKEAR
jgi:hypothetical protein